MSRYLEGTTHQLAEQLQSLGFTEGEVRELGEVERLRKILSEIRAKTTLIQSADLGWVSPLLVVDRTKAPLYPKRMTGGLMRPDLEFTGPDLFNVLHALLISMGSSEPRLGQETYDVFLDAPSGYVKGFGSLIDLLAIQEKGPVFYHFNFRGVKLVAIKSAGIFVENGGNFIRVPYLYEAKGGVNLGWRWLGHKFTSEYKALRIVT